VPLSDLAGQYFDARSPRIAGNSAGQAVVVYFNTSTPNSRSVWAIQYNSTSGFQAASDKVELNDALSGAFNRTLFPDVAVDAAGNAHVVWAQASGAYRPTGVSLAFPLTSEIFYAHFNGATWSAPQQVTSLSSEAAVDPRISATLGHVAVAFQTYTIPSANVTPTTYKVYGTRLSGGTWVEHLLDADAVALPQPLPSVGLSGVGDAHFVWTNRNEALTARYVASSGTWANSQNLASSSGAAQWPVLATTAGVEVMAAWIQANNGPFGMFVGRYH